MQGSDLPIMLKNLQTIKPDIAAGFYCGAPAQVFLRAWDKIGLRIPLVGGGGLHGNSVHSACAWVPALAGEQADQFRSAYPALLSPTADDFGLLGFEAAWLIHTALRAVDQGAAAGLRDALESVRVESPRGIVQMDPHTHLASGPLVRLTGGNERLAHPLQMPKLDNPRLQSLRASVKTGWSHAYLFV
jgi:ABC-type branched-subunit amino acid transport system substrate-binding protein